MGEVELQEFNEYIYYEGKSKYTLLKLPNNDFLTRFNLNTTTDTTAATQKTPFYTLNRWIHLMRNFFRMITFHNMTIRVSFCYFFLGPLFILNRNIIFFDLKSCTAYEMGTNYGNFLNN
jgi:hypothetical protein